LLSKKTIKIVLLGCCGMKSSGDIITPNEALEIGGMLRREVHRLNNLLLVVHGNVEILSLDYSGDDDVITDIMQSLKLCREVSDRLLTVGLRLENSCKL